MTSLTKRYFYWLTSSKRDLIALSEKVKWIQLEAEELSSKYPEHAESVEEQKVEVEEAWSRLQQKATSKRSNLTQEEQLQKFLDDYRDVL